MRFSVSGILPILNSSLLRLFIASLVLVLASASARAADSSIEIAGPGSPPDIGFACCDKGIIPMQQLFADPTVLSALVQLHAGVAVEIADFSPERAAIVRQLAQAGIPVTAWLVLAPEQGFYINAGNAPATAQRVAQFEQWTSDNHLQWAAVGLDIEPDFDQLAALKSHRWRLFTTLLRQALDSGRPVVAGGRPDEARDPVTAAGTMEPEAGNPSRPAPADHTSAGGRPAARSSATGSSAAGQAVATRVIRLVRHLAARYSALP